MINSITKLTSYVNYIVNIMINSMHDQVARLPVPEDKVSWSVEWAEYAPQDFTAPFVQGVSVRHAPKRCNDVKKSFRKSGLIPTLEEISTQSGTLWTNPSTGSATRLVKHGAHFYNNNLLLLAGSLSSTRGEATEYQGKDRTGG